MPRRRKPAPVHKAVLHLEPAPATPGQWEAWCWLWRRLLEKAPPPEALSAPVSEHGAGPDADQEEDLCTDHSDHQGGNDGKDRTE
jgi:hypothetical protein